jgi:hypothetical protein
MATISLDTSIDVVSKQRELIQEALGPDGAYIRLKETLKEFFDDGDLKDSDRVKLISETLAQFSIGITQGAMQTALQWSVQEKDLVLKKEELEYKLAILALEADKTEQEVAVTEMNKRLLQAKIIREYGPATINAEGDVTSLADAGTLYSQEQNVKQDTINKGLLVEQIQSQTDEVQARTHKLVADTYVNHGTFTWTNIGSTGITGAQKNADSYVTLSELNKAVAKEQAMGYAYNAWNSSVSASAGMLGTIIAAEVPDLNTAPYFQLWSDAMTRLNSISAPTISI